METPSFIRNSIKPLHWWGVLGPGRCVLPCSYTPQLPVLPLFCISRPGIPHPSDANWVGNSPSSLYQAYGYSRSTSLCSLYSASSVLQQLVVTPARSSVASATSGIFLEGTPIIRASLNADKSDLIPSQDFTFVGMNFLTYINKVRVSQHISDLLVKVIWVLSQCHITAQEFLSLNGILSPVADFVQLGRLFLRPPQH
ncbi:hypothetical protein DPMN_181835 [Dreissena polymorpha]|uniref:Uncharacterized protein n=1 Tax=Dreissena polymorpha TaxID=45954 RepID=A0A9D4DGY8_DREPO|nr:hypothetical protein DPMN_181835 [Dreissena polymorpha]